MGVPCADRGDRQRGKSRSVGGADVEREPRWGYRRIQGALSNLGHKIARSTITGILNSAVSSQRPNEIGKRDGKGFGFAPRELIVAADFFTVVRTIKESCLDCVILFGEASLRKAVHEFVAHYQLERNHQNLQNRLIIPDPQFSEIQRG